MAEAPVQCPSSIESAHTEEEEAHPQPTVLTNLPFDILHTLLDFVSPIDFVSLCSTCRYLYDHIKNESLWKHVCASCGLRDFRFFGEASPYTIYTQLLYPYGPLLGLWASDQPFSGRIIEFRIIPGCEVERGGIVGEIWSFPRSEMNPDEPTLPDYVRTLKITLDASCEDHPTEPGTAQVRIYCGCGTPHVERLHFASILRLSEFRRRHHVEFYRRTTDLPEFPKIPDCAWYDDTTLRLPHIPVIVEPDVDQRELIKIYPAFRLPIIWVSPTANAPRTSISICCARRGECECATRLEPAPPFPSLEPSPPRYYPLKRRILPGIDPRSSSWTIDSLHGLWYGSFGTLGTECLYLHEANSAQAMARQNSRGVVATKITGDIHVPRGAISWVLDEADEDGQDDHMAREYWADMRPGGALPDRILMGRGVLAARGYIDTSVVGVMGGVMGPDEIQIFWTALHDFRTYRRYPGREYT